MYANTNSDGGQVSSVRGNLVKVSKSNLCPHCGKPDWCYSIGELSVCSRDQPPATGWEATSKADKEGHVFYARPQEKKAIRPKQACYWDYPDRNGAKLARVERTDDGKGGKKKIYQKGWNGVEWQGDLEGIDRGNIPIYRHADIRKAIAKNELIFITEGEPCADALWALGLAATTNIGGSGKWRASDTRDLEGAKVVIVPDRDQIGIKHAELLAQEFPDALWLYSYPDSKTWENLPESQGLDVADWIKQYPISAEDIKAAIGEKKALAPLQVNNKPPTKSKNKQLLDLVETHWGERLRFNEMTQQVELDNKTEQLDIERIYLRLADELGVDIPKQTASDLVVVTAHKNNYSPVRDYLDSLTEVAPIDLDDLALRWFGTDDTLHATFLKRTLIAAVARVYKPGCKVDTLCILQGIQGLFKSLLWQTLTGEAWFTDNLSEANEKDEKLKIRRFWILEFGEFETIYKRKDVEQLKSFLSSRIDSLRRPYGRSIEDFPRTSVFVGSTNRQEILHDPTGGRRYWVIPVQQRIPIKTVEAERDAVWAAAVSAYKSGEQWWLTPEEDKLLAEANKSWQSSDTWEASILNHLQDKSVTTVSELLTRVIGLDLAQQKKGEQMRVSDILRCNGWTKVTKRIEGKLQKCWQKVVTEVGTEVVTPQDLFSVRVSDLVMPSSPNEVVTEVVTPQNPSHERVSDIVLPPVTTYSLKHSTKASCATEVDENESCKLKESFENIGGNTFTDNAQSLSQQGSRSVTTSCKRGGNTSPPTPSKVGTKHKEFYEGDRVVIAEVGHQNEKQHGEIVSVDYGSGEKDYMVKLDKESRGLQRVRVTVPDYSKSVYLMSE